MEEQSRSTDVENLNRRDLVKSAGLAAFGLIYTRPAIETIMVESAFASYGNDPDTPQPPVDGEDDQELEVYEFGGHVYLRGKLPGSE